MLCPLETLRPKSLEAMIGNRETWQDLAQMVAEAKAHGAPLRLYLQGDSGTGKTTVARIVSRMLECEPTEANVYQYMEVNGSEVYKLYDSLVSWLRQCSMAGSEAWKVLVVNESQGLRDTKVVEKLLSLLEDSPLPPRRCIIFTTTEPAYDDKGKGLYGEFTKPLLGRFDLVLELPKPNATEAGSYLERIATEYNINSRPSKHYVELVYRHQGSIRDALKEMFSSNGKFSITR